MVAATPLRRLSTVGLLSAGAALLFLTRPQLGRYLEPGEGKSAGCLDNLSQISRAYALYARDFDGKFPLALDPEDRFNTRIWRSPETQGTLYESYLQTAPFLHVLLRPYVASPETFRCPADVGWTISKLQTDPRSGVNQGLTNVLPSSFAKYGTSYYSWTQYGFDLQTAADIPDPARRVLIFDGDVWHRRGGQERAGELFIDGHAELVTQAQHHAFKPSE